MSFSKILSSLLSFLVALPCIISFLSLLDLVKIQWFDKFFCYTGDNPTELLYKKFFIDTLSLYVVFLSSSHFGMSVANENKKSPVMIMTSLIPIIVILFSLKQSIQYREILLFFVIIGISIVEKLYDISNMIPRYILKIRIIVSLILCSSIFYTILFF